MKIVFAFKLSYVICILLINVKMATIVGISTFMSRINFMLSLVEPQYSFITMRPEHYFFISSIHKGQQWYLRKVGQLKMGADFNRLKPPPSLLPIVVITGQLKLQVVNWLNKVDRLYIIYKY